MRDEDYTWKWILVGILIVIAIFCEFAENATWNDGYHADCGGKWELQQYIPGSSGGGYGWVGGEYTYIHSSTDDKFVYKCSKCDKYKTWDRQR